MPPWPGHTHHLVLEPQEVGAVEVSILEQQRGVALLQISASQSDQRPDLGKGGARAHGCPASNGLRGDPLPTAGAERRLSSPGEEESSEEELLEGPGSVLSALVQPWLRAGAE